MKVTLTVLSVGFVLYVLWIALQFGIKKSISESYYVLQKSGHGYYFTFFMFFISACLVVLIIQIEKLGGYSSTWTFLYAAGGAVFTGSATAYLKRVSRLVHFLGAGTLIFMCLLGIGLMFGNWFPISFIGGVLFGVLLFRKVITVPKIIYWFEVLCFVVIMFGFYWEIR